MNNIAIVTLGYRQYVVSVEDACVVANILMNAERYEFKYVAGGKSAHYVYPNDATDSTYEIKLIPRALYDMAKLAGKPTE